MSKEAMKLALEALNDERYVTKYTHIVEAIAAIKEALAAPVQEPVALKAIKGELCYLSQEEDQSFGMWCPINISDDLPFADGTDFYTAPPQRKPLTEERNFCSRCGKRLASGFVEISIHTCTPPQEKNT